MKTPQLWKHLKRHPLSAAYRDITGAAREAFVAKMRVIGFLKTFPIILHDGQVLDGWQRLSVCIELNIVPTFSELPDGITPEDYVIAVNDARRHETAEEADERVAARRERAAEARASGKSTRTIAAEEGVSQATVLNDLKAKSGEQGCSPEKPKQKVTGRDGKKYEAKKPAEEPPDFDEPPATKKPKAGKPRFDEKLFDKAYGGLVRVIDQRGHAMGKGPHHMRCQKILGEFIDEYKLWKKETA